MADNKHISTEERRQLCFCASPVPNLILGYGETLLLEQCGLCHKILRQPCDKCGDWTKNIFEHMKIKHPKPRKAKTS